jgi:hypothetical protein
MKKLFCLAIVMLMYGYNINAQEDYALIKSILVSIESANLTPEAVSHPVTTDHHGDEYSAGGGGSSNIKWVKSEQVKLTLSDGIVKIEVVYTVDSFEYILGGGGYNKYWLDKTKVIKLDPNLVTHTSNIYINNGKLYVNYYGEVDLGFQGDGSVSTIYHVENL